MDLHPSTHNVKSRLFKKKSTPFDARTAIGQLLGLRGILKGLKEKRAISSLTKGLKESQRGMGSVTWADKG